MRLLHKALVVGLLQRVGDGPVFGNLAPGRTRLADGALVKGLHQRVGNGGKVDMVHLAITVQPGRPLAPLGLAVGGPLTGVALAALVALPTLALWPLWPVRTWRPVTLGALWRRAVAPVVVAVVAPASTLAVPRRTAVRRLRGLLTRRTWCSGRAGAGRRQTCRPRTGLVAPTRCQAPHFTHLGLVQVHEQATAQATRQHHAAVTDADQPADTQADFVKQLAHLTVAAFGDDHPVPAVDPLAATVFDGLETGALAVDLDTIDEAGAGVVFQRAQHPHRVFTLHAKTRVHQLVGQFTGVGEQQQAFGVDVQPAHRLPLAMRQARQAAVDGGAVLRVVVGDDLAHRLVVGNDARRRRRNAHLDQLAGHHDAVTKRDALAGVRRLTVDHHLALGDQLFHVAA